MVGDIPIRVGDRVTTSTVITTIDDKQGLEAYIQVPLDSLDAGACRPAGAAARQRGQGRGDEPDHVRGAAGRRSDADGAGEEPAARGTAGLGPRAAVPPRAHRLARSARAEGSGHRGRPHQRAVLLLRRRTGAGRRARRQAETDRRRPGHRQRLCRAQRPQGRRQTRSSRAFRRSARAPRSARNSRSCSSTRSFGVPSSPRSVRWS